MRRRLHWHVRCVRRQRVCSCPTAAATTCLWHSIGNPLRSPVSRHWRRRRRSGGRLRRHWARVVVRMWKWNVWYVGQIRAASTATQSRRDGRLIFASLSRFHKVNPGSRVPRLTRLWSVPCWMLMRLRVPSSCDCLRLASLTAVLACAGFAPTAAARAIDAAAAIALTTKDGWSSHQISHRLAWRLSSAAAAAAAVRCGTGGFFRAVHGRVHGGNLSYETTMHPQFRVLPERRGCRRQNFRAPTRLVDCGESRVEHCVSCRPGGGMTRFTLLPARSDHYHGE